MSNIYSINYYYYRKINNSFWLTNTNENGIYLLEAKNKKIAENISEDVIKNWLIEQKIISEKDEIKIVVCNIEKFLDTK